MDIRLQITLKNKNGEVLKQDNLPFKSFLPVWSWALYATSNGFSDPPDVVNTEGNVITLDNSGNWFSMRFSVAHNDFNPLDNWGIVFGRDATPVTVNDFALGDKIPHGDNEGELMYQPIEYSMSEDYEVRKSARFSISRSVVNESNNIIRIREIGLYLMLSSNNGHLHMIVCIGRDTLGAMGWPVSPQDEFSITYIINMPV